MGGAHRLPDAVGVDLGGTHLRAAVVQGDRIRLRHREPVGNDRDPRSIAARIAAFVSRHAPPGAPVGVGVAAMLRGFDGFVAHSPHLGWRDEPFGAALRRQLPGRPIGVYNDVNAVTFGEYAAGAGRGSRDVVAVFVGTGVGGGAVLSGRLLTGFSNTCAELGHLKVVLTDDARLCNCGLRGCVEAYCGGSYLLARFREELAAGARSAAVDLAGGDPEAVTAAHVDAAARAGDPWAAGLWREIAPLLGVAIANTCTAFNPEVVVLGGGVIDRAPTLTQWAIDACMRWVNPPARVGLRIERAALGDDAGVIGSARLAAEGVHCAAA